MARSAALVAALLLSTNVHAAYDEFFFASEESDWKCPGIAFTCIPPQICVHDNLLNKNYCCDGGFENAVCWNGAQTCGGDNDEPSGSQLGCGSGDSKFCCLNGREECTQTSGQINICWAKGTANPAANISVEKLNDTFSSLSSARPSATTFSFDLKALTISSTSSSSSSATTTSGSSSSSSGSSTTSSTSSDSSQSSGPSQTSTSVPESSSGVSGGAIGGAVVGGVAGLALIGGAIFYFMRRKKKNEGMGELDGSSTSNPYLAPHHAGGYNAVPQEKYASEAPLPEPVEMPNNSPPVEMEGSSVPRAS